MKVRISLEQTIDIDDAMSNDIGFELYGPKEDSLICVPCWDGVDGEEVDEEALPQGFTCDECWVVIK